MEFISLLTGERIISVRERERHEKDPSYAPSWCTSRDQKSGDAEAKRTNPFTLSRRGVCARVRPHTTDSYDFLRSSERQGNILHSRAVGIFLDLVRWVLPGTPYLPSTGHWESNDRIRKSHSLFIPKNAGSSIRR